MLITPKVSLFASSVRPQLYESFFKSLEGTTVEYEVKFAGNCPIFPFMKAIADVDKPAFVDRFDPKIFKYIKTGNIKPAQCYEIARRHCTGEVVVWAADDCEFPDDVIGKAYKYWKASNNESLILSIQTKESGYGNPEGSLFNMNHHRFFGYRTDTPLMAPLGMMSRKFLDYLGGIDRRYVSGQYENDLVMRAYNEGASVEIFGEKDCYIDIDHLGKSIAIGESTDQSSFRERPFAQGYAKDREVLEGSWTPLVKMGAKYKRYDKFEPYENKDLLTKSQSNKGIWE